MLLSSKLRVNDFDAMLAETLERTKSTKEALNVKKQPEKEGWGNGNDKSDH